MSTTSETVLTKAEMLFNKILPHVSNVYELKMVSVLGKGAFGTVYKVMDSNTGELYVLKVATAYNPLIMEMALREKKVLDSRNFADTCGINRSFVCTTINKLIMVDDSRYALILMPYIPDSESLQEFINTGFPHCTYSLDPPNTCLVSAHNLAKATIVQNAVHAITIMHNAGIAHRDIKPDNLLVLKNLKIYVIDFGTACINNNPNLACKNILGTLDYMAPEEFTASIGVHPTFKSYDLTFAEQVKADIWSLGISLWQLFIEGNTDKMPYQNMQSMNRERQQALFERVYIEFPPEQAAILAPMLVYDPDHRRMPSEEDIATFMHMSAGEELSSVAISTVGEVGGDATQLLGELVGGFYALFS